MIGIGFTAFAQEQVGATAEVAQEPTISADEQQIRDSIVRFVEYYNTRDAKAIAGQFLPNGVVIFSDGEQYEGQADIEQHFADTFANRPEGTISIDVESIRFLTPDVAIERGVTDLFPDGETLSVRAPYTVYHIKQNGRWQMAQVRVGEEEIVSAYATLQPLEWLIGEWVDEGRDEVVEVSFRWDDNKSFLLEEFRVVSGGDVVLKGSQRIGWDPQSKQIRAWTFDSKGGFGESTWTELEDGWLIKSRGVSASGESASVTRNLTRTAEDRVIWLATDRILGDERLPDLEVTMVRKPPAPQL
jgi:uncharacterized protein (TIGR02246 family)